MDGGGRSAGDMGIVIKTYNLSLRDVGAKRKGGPKDRPSPNYPKEDYVGGKGVNRHANCAPNVNNPSR